MVVEIPGSPSSAVPFSVERIHRLLVVVGAGAAVSVIEWVGALHRPYRFDPVRILVALLATALLGAVSWIVMRHHWGRRVEELHSSTEADLSRSKDTFIANVSHGLRTPLTAVVGFAGVLEEQTLPPDQDEAVKTIIAESAELSRMVDDLVVAAQIDAGVTAIALEPVSMLDAVERVISFMGLLGADVAIDLPDVEVLADRERLVHILRNLLTNAHRHGKPTITVRGHVSHGRYICHVVDQGPGVTASEREHLFTRFSSSTVGSRFNGSIGLGLAVVAELAERMGTQISYRRIRGETQFVLSMPLADESGAAGPRVIRGGRPRLVAVAG